MKNFDDFVKYVNESESVRSTLDTVKMELETDSLDLSNPEDISALIFAIQKQSLNQFMQVLRSYHEWFNEK